MKTKNTSGISFFERGMDEWEMTAEYKAKASKITRETTDKYSAILLNEKSWFRRLLIKIRRENEIRREMDKLSSRKNLHVAGIF